MSEEILDQCPLCNHKKSLHHANEIQEFWTGAKFHRTCFEIGCKCGNMFDDYPHIPLKVKRIKKKKHWFLRFLKRQKIQLDIKVKRIKKKLRRRYVHYLTERRDS